MLSFGKYLPVAAAAGAFAAVSGAGYLITSQPRWAHGGNPPVDDGVEMLERVPSRMQQLAKLRESTRERPFDLLIIGAGATGAGCAVDAVTRWVGGEGGCAAATRPCCLVRASRAPCVPSPFQQRGTAHGRRRT